MAGTKTGGQKALATNKARYGDDFYKVIGSKGGKAGHTGGFAFGNNGAKFGAIGGRLSRRGRVVNIGDMLNQDERIILLELSQRVLDDIKAEGKLTADEYDDQLRKAAMFCSSNEWAELFTLWGGVNDISIRWYSVLIEKTKYYHKLILSGKITEDSNSDYRAVRALCNAYRSATGRRVSLVEK